MNGIAEINPSNLESVHTKNLQLPYVDMGQVEPAIKLVMNDTDYWYFQTLPLRGYSAILDHCISQVREDDEDRKILLARFWNRIYIYATGIKPIGAGKPPGG